MDVRQHMITHTTIVLSMSVSGYRRISARMQHAVRSILSLSVVCVFSGAETRRAYPSLAIKARSLPGAGGGWKKGPLYT